MIGSLPDGSHADPVSNFFQSDKEMDTIVFGEEMLKKLTSKLKSTASPGPDGIQGNLYKTGGKFMMDAMVDITNQSVQSSYAPVQTRIAWICPCWKG